MRRLPRGRWRLDEWRGRAFVPLVIYACLTLVSATFLTIGGANQLPVLDDEVGPDQGSSALASPGYWGVLANWDGQWFKSIALNGYPVPLPTEDGVVTQNEWAFLPLYPFLVRGLMALTNLPFITSAWILSLSFGALAMVGIYNLVLSRVGAFTAGALVAAVCAFPTAVLFQAAYPESMALCLIVGALLALRHRRYFLVMLAALGLALTRPIVLPLAAVVAIHGLARLRSEGRDFNGRDRWLVGVTAVVTAALLGLWPAIADLTTGHRNSYLDTLAAWPVNQHSAGVLGGWFSTITAFTPAGLAALATILGVVFLSARRAAQRWGLELRAWALVYPLYLFAATRPSPSIIRYLMLAIAPLWPFPEPPSLAALGRFGGLARWLPLVLLLGVELTLQFAWATHVFTFASWDEQVWFP